MPFQIACPGCQRKYNLADNLRGKAIKCKECGKAFKLPAAPGATPAAGRQVGGQQPVKQKQAAGQQAAPAAAPFGLDPLKNESDLFSGATPAPNFDPLGNHVVGDPGFAAVDPSMFAKKEEDEDTSDSLYYNPAAAELAAQIQQQNDAYFNPKFNYVPAIAAACVLGGTAILTLILAVVAPDMAFIGMLLMCLAAGGSMGAAEIWLLVRIKNHPDEGDKFMTYFFIAWMRYSFLHRYWNQQKDVGTFYYLAIAGILVAAAMIFLVGVLTGM